LDVTLFLANQNLPFRGHREGTTSENKGNFLELIELLSNYDPVLKEHLVKIQQNPSPGKVMTTYLSSKTQNEFISLLGNSVKKRILCNIRKAKYFGILFDSTPDVSHTDQMCEIIRDVHIESGKVEVRESFLGFFPLAGKKADDLTEEILKSLKLMVLTSICAAVKGMTTPQLWQEFTQACRQESERLIQKHCLYRVQTIH
jgi:hypothetical protein